MRKARDIPDGAICPLGAIYLAGRGGIYIITFANKSPRIKYIGRATAERNSNGIECLLKAGLQNGPAGGGGAGAFPLQKGPGG